MEEPVDMAILTRNIQLVAEALARYMFALSDSGLVCYSIKLFVHLSILTYLGS